jgi:hypothetical protein
MKCLPLIIVFAAVLTACNNSNEKAVEQTATDTANISGDPKSNPVAQTPASQPFSKEVSYKNIKFAVSSPGLATGNSFTVIPSGLTEVNDPVTEQMDGMVTEVSIDEIDGDDSPELCVITKQGEKVKAYIYSANKNKSLSSVYFPEMTDAKLLAGHKGGDEYAFVEGTFIQRFPLFDGESKTGKTRQLQYKLKPGEASKKLVLDRTIEY